LLSRVPDAPLQKIHLPATAVSLSERVLLLFWGEQPC
jgi:hypothetical protein